MTLLTGSDCLAILPTSAGKTLLYMVAGSLVRGITIVHVPVAALAHEIVLPYSHLSPSFSFSLSFYLAISLFLFSSHLYYIASYDEGKPSFSIDFCPSLHTDVRFKS